MISFIFRFAFVSFLGMLMNPGQLQHKLPTEAQIMHVTNRVEHDPYVRKLLQTRMSDVKKDAVALMHTARTIESAVVEMRQFVARVTLSTPGMLSNN